MARTHRMPSIAGLFPHKKTLVTGLFYGKKPVKYESGGG